MEYASGNIFIRKNPMVAGRGEDSVVHGHKHNFDHTTIFFSGKWHVKATLPSGKRIDRDFEAPDSVLIKANVEHEITCLESGEFWCVYAHHTPQGDIVQQYTGWEEAYC